MHKSLNIKLLSLVSVAFLTVFSFCKNNDSGVKTSKGSNDPNSSVNLPMNPDGTVDTTKVAKMEFEQPIFEFDTVKEGTIVTHAFKFKNTGAVPLIISDAKSSCGCTVPEWPTEAVEPGGTGEITAKFNTTHKMGGQNKVVRVSANIYPGPATVALKGFVLSKEGKVEDGTH